MEGDFLWLLGMLVPWVWCMGLAFIPQRADHFSRSIGTIGSILGAVLITSSLFFSPPSKEIETLLRFGWIHEIGLDFLIIRDGLSALFAVLVVWISVLVTVYAWQYLPNANEHEGSDRSEASFYALMSAFTASMLGVVSAGNLLQIYVFWEITTVSSFKLIGYWNHQEEARDGAFLALILTVAGSVAMLVGFFWLGIQTGEWAVPDLVEGAKKWQGGLWLEGCAGLILLGALAKSAQFPFSSWLPAAMNAPTPVSAFLHSSALLAAGVYLLARFYTLLHTTGIWWWFLVIPGSLGVLYAGLLAFRQDKMKPMLAYSTIGQFGFMFTAFGVGTKSAIKAALYAFFVHAFIKAGLFLVSGSVTHITGSKKFEKAGALIRSNRVLAACGLILGLSLAGAPALGAFYYEEKYLRAVKEEGALGLYIVFVLGGVLSVLYMLRFLHELFIRGKQKGGAWPRVPVLMGSSIGVTAAAALVTAIFPNWMNAALVTPAVESTLRAAEHLEVEILIDTVFWSSIIGLFSGLTLWWAWRRSETVFKWWRRLPDTFSLGGGRAARVYSLVSSGLLLLHTGDLRFYLRVIFGSSIALTVVLWVSSGLRLPVPERPVDVSLTLVLFATVIVAGATAFARYHLTFVLILTMTGFGLSAAFLLMGAPNIALAQVLVETLIDLSIILALRESFMIDPDETQFLRSRRPDPLRWGLALGIGAAVGLGVYWSTQTYPPGAVGQWYADNALSETGMEDFVAAVLTDFRSLDTLVEVLVFTAGIFAVIGLYWHEEISGE